MRIVACIFAVGLVLGAGRSAAQEGHGIDVGHLPAAWARQLRAGRVAIEVNGVGDWEVSEEAHRVITLTSPVGSSDSDQLSIDGARCRSALRTLRDLAPVRRLGRGPLQITLSLGRIGRGARTLASPDETLCQAHHPHDHRRVELHVLSLVGPVLTIWKAVASESAGGPPYYDQAWSTLDVRTGRPFAITDALDEGSLLDALRAYDWQSRGETSVPELASARTWSSALEILRRALRADGGGPFAFVDWDEVSGLAEIALTIPTSTCGMCPNEPEVIRLRARPRASFLPELRAAARGAGHLFRAGEVDAF